MTARSRVEKAIEDPGLPWPALAFANGILQSIGGHREREPTKQPGLAAARARGRRVHKRLFGTTNLEMDDHDPLNQFFPDEPDVNLYSVLSLTPSATTSEIKSAYRRLALRHHPDKHATSSPDAQKDASTRFQQVGFAYTVLGDEKRKKRYDDTGKTDEGMDWEGKDEDGWKTYFEEMFEKVTRGKLDEMKKEYQGSAEETADLCSAYIETGGSIAEIISHIPHSNHSDEARFIKIIDALIGKGKLEALSTWTEGVKDTKARAARKKKGEREAREAEGLAKELGVWDEFYGSGKEGTRRGKGKGKGAGKANDEGDADGEATLKALIHSRQKKMGGFFDSLAAKYGGESEPRRKGQGKGKKRAAEDATETEGSPRKKARSPPAEPDIDDEKFARIQQKLLAGKKEQKATAKSGRATRVK